MERSPAVLAISAAVFHLGCRARAGNFQGSSSRSYSSRLTAMSLKLMILAVTSTRPWPPSLTGRQRTPGLRQCFPCQTK
ncbi:unnamed protein product [Lampetra planeri]